MRLGLRVQGRESRAKRQEKSRDQKAAGRGQETGSSRENSVECSVVRSLVVCILSGTACCNLLPANFRYALLSMVSGRLSVVLSSRLSALDFLCWLLSLSSGL